MVRRVVKFVASEYRFWHFDRPNNFVAEQQQRQRIITNHKDVCFESVDFVIAILITKKDLKKVETFQRNKFRLTVSFQCVIYRHFFSYISIQFERNFISKNNESSNNKRSQ